MLAATAKSWRLGKLSFWRANAEPRLLAPYCTLIVKHTLHSACKPLSGLVGSAAVYRLNRSSLSKANKMIRPGNPTSLTRSSLRKVPFSTARNTTSLAPIHHLTQQAPRVFSIRKSSPLALTTYKPFSTSLQRCVTLPGPYYKVDTKHEKEVKHEELPQHPEEVSATSSVHQIFHEKNTEEPEKDEDMLAGVKADFVSLHGTQSDVDSY